jgi:hypothetical protein
VVQQYKVDVHKTLCVLVVEEQLKVKLVLLEMQQEEVLEALVKTQEPLLALVMEMVPQVVVMVAVQVLMESTEETVLAQVVPVVCQGPL